MSVHIIMEIHGYVCVSFSFLSFLVLFFFSNILVVFFVFFADTFVDFVTVIDKKNYSLFLASWKYILLTTLRFNSKVKVTFKGQSSFLCHRLSTLARSCFQICSEIVLYFSSRWHHERRACEGEISRLHAQLIYKQGTSVPSCGRGILWRQSGWLSHWINTIMNAD